MKNLLPVLILVMAAACNREPAPVKAGKYPVTLKVDTVDQYFGTAVPDPYRWLENDTATATEIGRAHV